MNAIGITQVQEVRRKMIKKRKKPQKIMETNEKTVNKLLAGEIYEKEDILPEVEIKMEKYHYVYDKQFSFIDEFDKIDDALKKIHTEHFRPHIIVYGKPEKRWVMICVVQRNVGLKKNITLVYKDPCGDEMSIRVAEKFKTKYPNAEIINNTYKQQDVKDEPSYGPLTLRNIEVFFQQWFNIREKLSKFSTLRFPLLAELKDKQITSVMQASEELSNKKPFLKALRKFIDDLPIALAAQVNEVKEQRKSQGGQDNSNSRTKRKKISLKDVDAFKDKYKAKENKNYKPEIERKFPKEVEKLSNMFKILHKVKVDEDFYAVLKEISKRLEIDYDTLKGFYEFQTKTDDDTEFKFAAENITDIANNLPTMMTESECTDCASLDQILADTVIGMDKKDALDEETEEKQTEQDKQTELDVDDIPMLDEKEKIKLKYFGVVEAYENWKDRSIKDIHTWAMEHKGKLGTSDDAVCEAIAIMDRAFNLLTGGWHFRIPQVLAVIIFLHGQKYQGRLCQVQTGEGKSFIVALLTIIKCLQGYTVDVITSSPILAQEGVTETKTFLSVFGLSVSTNNRLPDGTSNWKAYRADIVYGTIGNFQFDYLKDSLDGDRVRQDRKFDVVILDEVDSMLIDNAGHIAKLSSPYPGMECLRYIYIKIWQALCKAEKEFAKQTQEDLKNILNSKDDIKLIEPRYAEYVKSSIAKERPFLKERIKASNPTDIPFIPRHLEKYVVTQLDTWISNAIYAKYNCHEHKQYRVMDDEGVKKIVPVDYLNTGVTMKNTIWSKGLHQFVQLKHNLSVDFETLTSSYISNIGYIRLFKSENIFGMTGTLGSRAEQELLASVYHIDYAKIPTFKRKKFSEIPGIVVEDDFWANQVTVEILAMLDKSRGVLAVFETEQDVLTVEKYLRILQTDDVRIRMYSNEEHADETKEKVNVGDVILATNIAGRGTNFKTTKLIEANGGLHVIVGFLPVNLRVEGQAFGRTSRQGNDGTAQLIIRRDEVEQLGVTDKKVVDFEIIKKVRDRLERDRLDKIRNELVKELIFKDELYAHFAKLHREEKMHNATKEHIYVLKDLKEFWANWLERKQFRGKNIDKVTASAVFEEFKKDASDILNGKISHNPYYAVALADYFLRYAKMDKAVHYIRLAKTISGGTNIPGAYMKEMEYNIEKGQKFYCLIFEIIQDLLSINIAKALPSFTDAKNSVHTAQEQINEEKAYIDNLFHDSDFTSILIAKESENGLVKNLMSRLYCLLLHSGSIDKIIEELNKDNIHVVIKSRAPANLDNLRNMLDKAVDKNRLCDADVKDFESVGLNTIYTIESTRQLSKETRDRSLVLISAGIVALGAGAIFAPIFPLMSTLAETLISEGVVDLVMALLFGEDDGPPEIGDYVKDKLIAVGISLVTFGISAIEQSEAVVKDTIHASRELSYMSEGAEFVDIAEDGINTVKKIEAGVSEFTKLEKVTELTKLERFQKGLINVGKATVKALAESIVHQIAIPMVAQTFTGSLIDRLKEKLEQSIRSNKKLMMRLRISSLDEILRRVDDFINEDLRKHHAILHIPYQLGNLKQKQSLQFFKAVGDLVENNMELHRYLTYFSKYLEAKLRRASGCDNDVEYIIGEVCGVMNDKIFSLWCTILDSNIATVHSAAKMTFADEKVTEKELFTTTATLFANVAQASQSYALFGLKEGAPLEEVTRKYRSMRIVFNDHEDRQNISDKFKYAYELIVNKLQENKA